MDWKFLKQQRLSRTNGYDFAVIEVNLSTLTATQSGTGVVIGSEIVTGAVSSNTVTLKFKEPLDYAPRVWYQPVTANAAINETSASTTQLVFAQVQRDSNGTGISTGVVRLYVIIPYGLGLI